MKKIYFLFLLVVLQVNSQIVNIPDANFKVALINQGVDINSDGNIQVTEAAVPTILYLEYSNIQDITGIQSFVNLNYLQADHNSIFNANLSGLNNLIRINLNFNFPLNSINVSGCNNLEELLLFECNLNTLNISSLGNLRIVSCSENNLTNISITNCINLKELYCAANNLSFLNVSEFSNLEILVCRINNITSIDLSNSPNLKLLDCSMNSLTNLNVNNCSQIERLECVSNNLSVLNLPSLPFITDLFCGSNNLTSLDLSSCPSLVTLLCSFNNLTSLFLKNGAYEGNPDIPYSYIEFNNNPNIEFICCDEFEQDYFQIKANSYGYTNCNINYYCSFTPGGNYYTIQGSQKFDSNINGCDSNDVLFPNLNFNITDGFSTGNIIANTSGDYSIFVGQGTHTITPILENPTYFNVAPSSLQVTLPNASNPTIQNFCITPNGVHNDLEVVIIPLFPARPGFDATYKILYKNKGNTTLSGSVVLDFEDNKMDFVSSTPSYTSISTGELIYNYSDLAPFEIREIIITMNINSPTETPAVNIGDQLSFIVNINPLSGDEYVQDNRINFKQTVVGSYDPNDKTCIEGDVVGAEVIGNYVHYLIRFENTGTFTAENIVVKDIIDYTKFDINTLTPTSSSHPFVTKISNSTIVEFIFENIQLPFDDANNDGYVAFKIKTLPSLSIGDTFSNNANIYFDYNFPIGTNTTLTTIQNLNKPDFEFTDYITLYPNPANSKLNFKVKKDLNISSINIYNSLGQLVLVATNPNEFIDVSQLKTGNYFVKIISNLGFSNCQFLKE
jgi:uncharacterized repeat protein (TIGR01451 family)